MGTVEEFWQNPAYRHVVLNHLPITGVLVAWLVLLAGAFLRDRAVSRLGLVLVVAMAGSAFVAIQAGEQAYPTVYESLGGDGRERLDRHADMAGDWGLWLYGTGFLAALGLVLSSVQPSRTTAVAIVVAIAAFGNLATVLEVADVGGEIRHASLRTGGASEVAADDPVATVAMRRLDPTQYRRALADAFGDGIEVVGRFEPEQRVAGLLAVGRAQMTITTTGFEQYEAMANAVAGQVIEQGLVGCEPASPSAPDDACVESFVRRAGQRLFRRSLTDGEVRLRVAAAHAAAAREGDFFAGLKVAAISLLTAPDFLFRIETTAGAESGSPGQVSPDTLASRLSYLLWDAAPDARLRAAAARGELADPAARAVEVDRMLASPRLRDGVRTFFADLFRFDEFAELNKDLGRYPLYTPTLAEDAREQTLRTVVDHLVERDLDYRDLFTTRRSFLTRTLGPLYRVPVGSRRGWEPMEFPSEHPRAGLLSHASFAMLHAHPGRSSPTLRGKFLREALLCQTVPPAPADVEFALFNDDQSEEFKTARDRLEVHSTNASCRGCHRLTDPIGLGLERLDGMGQFRTDENGARIDPSGDLDGTPFADARDLGRAFRDHERLVPCLVQMLYRYAVGRTPARQEAPVLEELESVFVASGHRFPALLRAVALSDALRTAPTRASTRARARASVPTSVTEEGA